MVNGVRQQNQITSICLSEESVCKAMAAIEAVKGIGERNLGDPDGQRLLALSEQLEGIIYGGDIEPGRNNARS